MQDGTIGSELVIRPLPVKHRRKPSGLQLLSGSQDDELFMDEEDFRSSDFMTPSSHPSANLPEDDEADNVIRKRRSTQHSIGSHVIYKRQVLKSESDYGRSCSTSLPFVTIETIAV